LAEPVTYTAGAAHGTRVRQGFQDKHAGCSAVLAAPRMPVTSTRLDQAHHAIDRHDLFAVVGFLARTKSRLLAISLEDLLGVVDQPNIPGTVDEHPNWRRRLPLALDEIASAIDVAALKRATAERTRAAV